MITMPQKKKLFLVDVMALAFRSHYAFINRPLTTKAGFPTSAIYGSVLSLIKIFSEEQPDYLVFASDSPEKTFRHELYSGYKAGRSEMPQDLARQIPHIYRLLELFEVPMIRLPFYEADDIIGSFAAQFASSELQVYICSKDKDFMQLVNENVHLLQPLKAGEFGILDPKGVFELVGCRPEQIRDYLAICGDDSDNIPGVKGIGKVGAVKLLNEFASLDGIYANLQQVLNKRFKTALETSRENAKLSYELAGIKKDIALNYALSDLACDPNRILHSEKIADFCYEMEFTSLLKRFAKNREISPIDIKNSNIEKNLHSIDKADFQLIHTKDALLRFQEELQNITEVSFDCETTGLDIINDTPIGVSFSTSNKRSYYLPLLESQLKHLSVSDVQEVIKKILENKSTLKIAHNIKFDLQVLSNIGIEVQGPIFDTMIAGFLIDPLSESLGIDSLSKIKLGITKTPITDLIGEKNQIKMSAVALEKLYPYACEDAYCCFALYEKFKTELREKDLENLFTACEMPIARILAKMEQRGIKIDCNSLFILSEKLTAEKQKLEQKIYAIAGQEFNINSPKQLQHILYEKLAIHEQLQLKPIKKTKSGYSTDVSVLEYFKEHPIAQELINYRMINKLQNTYVETLPQLINEKSGRIHTHFHQAGTQTGRLSSSNPNLQNIPIRSALGKEIRAAFVGYGDNLLVSADYSQIELRLLAHFSKDETLLSAFTKADTDIHRATAAHMFKKVEDEVDEGDRSKAKAINYGIIYGMGPNRLARTTQVSQSEAKNFIAQYFATFSRIKAYIDASIQSATQLGYSKTILGRKRPIVGLRGEFGSLTQSSAKNIAVNSPIQGSAADLIKMAMIHIEDEIAKQGLASQMLLQVHDELIFECPKSELEQLIKIIKVGMEEALPLLVPITVQIGSGANWLTAHG